MCKALRCIARTWPGPTWRVASVLALALPLPLLAQERIEPVPRAFITVANAAPHAQAEGDPAARPDPDTLRWRNRLVVGGSIVALAAFGGSRWWQGEFDGNFKSRSERWFGYDTLYGGVDKLGHAYSTMVGVRLLTPILQAVGNDAESARWMASLSTFAAFAAIEVIDGYSSRYSFSREDLIANAVGTLLGYAFEASPKLDGILDYRLNYRRSQYSAYAPFEDYDGQRYFLVFKPDGVASLRDMPALRYLEFVVGYGATGYDSATTQPQTRVRSTYLGVSINLSRVLADAAYGGQRGTTRSQRVADTVFDLVQFGTMVTVRNRLDP